MSLSSLFYGMEAYLDNSTTTIEDTSTPKNTSDHEVAATQQATEISDDTAEVVDTAKDIDLQSQMLTRMFDMYHHAKQYGVNRTFVALFNSNGELDRLCHVRYPSCESIPAVGNPRNRYSTVFISAMEDDTGGKSLWQKFKDLVKRVWDWIVSKVSPLWNKILQFFGLRAKDLDKLIQKIRSYANLTIPITDLHVPFLKRLLSENLIDKIGKADQEVIDSAQKIYDIINKNADTLLKASSTSPANSGDIQKLEEELTNAENKLKETIKTSEENNKERTNRSLAISLIFDHKIPNVAQALDTVTEYNKAAKKSLSDRDSLKKMFSDVIKRIKDNTKDTDNSSSTGKFMVKCLSVAKEVSSNVVQCGKAIIKTVNSIYGELKRLDSELEQFSKSLEKDFDFTQIEKDHNYAAQARKHLSQYKQNDFSNWVGIDVYAPNDPTLRQCIAALVPPQYDDIPYTPENMFIVIDPELLSKARKNPNEMLMLFGILFHEVGHGLKVGASGRFEKRVQDKGLQAHLRWKPIAFEAMADRNVAQAGYAKYLLKKFSKLYGIKEAALLGFFRMLFGDRVANDIPGRIELLKRWIAEHGNDLATKI